MDVESQDRDDPAGQYNCYVPLGNLCIVNSGNLQIKFQENDYQ